MKKVVFLDTECYSNYFLVCFKSYKNTLFFELHNNSILDRYKIKKILENFTTVGFNSNNYDLPMLKHAISINSTNKSLKQLSDYIIDTKDRRELWNIFKKFNVYSDVKWDHIDLFNVAPKIDSEYKVGLKVYGSRMHTNVLQDLPLSPHTIIENHQHDLLRQYCDNDVKITLELYENIKPLIDLRVEIGKLEQLDLRSSSDAQIAEKLVRKHLKIEQVKNKISDIEIKYLTPSFIQLKDEHCLEWLEILEKTKFDCNDKGHLNKPKEIDRKFKIEGKEYSVGIGGIHSINTSEVYETKNDEYILDVDFTSYYPSIILHNNYWPKNLGKKFLDYYRIIYDKRLLAKENKDLVKSELYKIVLNGSFGKTSNIWSCMYDPSTALHITVTGQLCILMLIEKINSLGCEVISANTDGVTFKGKKSNLVKDIKSLKEWEKTTGLNLEPIEYQAIYHESVNSYIAIKKDGTLKCKGYYADQGLKKNPVASVCIEAVCQWIKSKKPIRETIFENKDDITKFLIVRKVTTGGTWKGKYLGKIVRWYYGEGEEGDAIYNKKGDRVSNSSFAIPLMNIENYKIPVNLSFYEELTIKILTNLGIIYDNVRK